jgi:uncharacterized protein (TIGR02757 family)
MPVADRLRQPLDRLCREFDWTLRVGQDAIQFPLRYTDPADIELAGLFASCMAYGRVDLFGAQVSRVLERMGDSPARFVWGFDLEKHRDVFAGFSYRFNRERDVLAFCLAAQRIVVRHGSLKAFFLEGFSPEHTDVGPAVERFAAGFRGQDLSAVFPRNRLSYGFKHWFPLPSTGGVCKRLHLYLRWMVRREPPDFGIWPEVPSRALLMPVDTHIENMARSIGLTRRRSRNWPMVEEITARLRRLDPEDPVKYDFALCHKRMSGQCLNRRHAEICAPCGLKPVCVHWRGSREKKGGVR